MLKKIEELLIELKDYTPSNSNELEEFRIKYLGQKGVVKDLFKDFKNVEPKLKKDFGLKLNSLKQRAQQIVDSFKDSFEELDSSEEKLDLTLPGTPLNLGSRHPVSLIRNEIIDIFSRVGFTVEEGPEIEDDWHNFTALNFPEEHPARDMQDTFFIDKEKGISLRTHTSSVQVRVMETQKPPIRIIAPGRVFRNEAISARAHCIFHQVEGLYIDKDVSFADLKQTLLYFAKEMFGEGTKIRLRPSYFPFTEPSAEMDISCNLCKGDGCKVCKYTGYLEIMGCGMVDPNVLENCGIDSKEYTGYAFGMGIERIAMLKYGVNDLRHYFENDLRFLNQFKAAY